MGTTLRKSQVIRFSPSTASDALDANDAPPGACQQIINLIPDPSTKNVWVAKPTAAVTNTMSNSATPHAGTISVFIVVGTLVYGLIENTVSGTETPFCIDASNVNSGAAVQVQNGFDTTIQPQTLSATGTPWLPTAALIGTKIVITHPGLAAIPANLGIIDISNIGFPVWYVAGLTATGGILSSHVSAGGTGYSGGSTGTTTTAQALTGGTGSGAKAIFHYTAGVVDWAVITAYGSGYLVGDILTIPAYFGGSGGRITVDAIQTTGVTGLFTSPPQWVAQFYQRAYYGENPTNGGVPSVLFSDILNPLSVTNANQALTFGDNLPTVAAMGLGLNNQLGGVVQSLMVFKSVSYIIQITGDAALSTLATNTLNVATGTTSSRGVVATPQGLAFAAPDGLRLISFDATVSDPIGAGGQGVTLPFTYGVEPFPANVVLGCNRGVIRASLQYQFPGGSAVQNEFWFDMTLKIWSGPHATAYGQYSNYKDTWLAFRGDKPASTRTDLLTILSYPGLNAAYAPNANCELTTVVMYPPETGMSQLEIVELIIFTTAPSQVPSMIVQIWDQDGNTIRSNTFSFNPATTPTTNNLYPRRISFAGVAVVNRFAIDISVSTPMAGLAGFKIGDIWIRYRDLGYLQELPG